MDPADRATEDAGRAAHAVTFAAEAHTPRDRASTSRAALPWSILNEGQAPQHLTKGESIWIDAGQRHWHGAALKQPMIHLTYQQAADDLSTIDWQEPVTPTTYSHETKENR